jgi:hypothetical protein
MPGLAAVSAAPAPSASAPAAGAQPSAPADLFSALLRDIAGAAAPPQRGKDDHDADRQGGALVALAANATAALPPPSYSAPGAQQDSAIAGGSVPRGSAGTSSASGDPAPAPPPADGETPPGPAGNPAAPKPDAIPSQNGADQPPVAAQVGGHASVPASSASTQPAPAMPPPPPPLPPTLAGRSIFVRHADAPNATFAVDLATLGATPARHDTKASATPTWTPVASAPPKPATDTTQPAPTQPLVTVAAVTPPGDGSASSSGDTGSGQGTQTAPGTHGAAPTSGTFGVALGSGLDTSGLAASLTLTIQSGVTEARLQLRPAGLGAVHVQIISGRDGVTLRLAAETAADGDLLRAHAGDLRDALVAHGVTVADLHILPNQPAPSSADTGGPTWQQDSGRRANRDAQDGSGNDAPPQDDDESSGQPQ